MVVLFIKYAFLVIIFLSIWLPLVAQVYLISGVFCMIVLLFRLCQEQRFKLEFI